MRRRGTLGWGGWGTRGRLSCTGSWTTVPVLVTRVRSTTYEDTLLWEKATPICKKQLSWCQATCQGPREEGAGKRETSSSHQLVIADGQVGHLAPIDQDDVEAALGLPTIDA